MLIGVLALQGNFAAHGKHCEKLNTDWIPVRKPSQLSDIDGLIIPGAESTALLKLMNTLNFQEAIRQFKKPIFGTCAGAILLAKQVYPKQESLDLIDISVERNAYGRQINSFTVRSEFENDVIDLVFIRAPRITYTGPSVKILIEHEGSPVLVQDGKILIATCHPEMTESTQLHKLFFELL